MTARKRSVCHSALIPPPLSPETLFLPLSDLNNNVRRDTTKQKNDPTKKQIPSSNAVETIETLKAWN